MKPAPEEDLPAEASSNLLGQPGLELVVEQVRAMHQDAGLFPDCFDDGGVAMAGIADGDAGHEVEVFLAGVVPDGYARAASTSVSPGA